MTGIKVDTMIFLMVNVVSASESHLLKIAMKEPYLRYQMLIIFISYSLELGLYYTTNSQNFKVKFLRI